jgi:hypothetical protein
MNNPYLTYRTFDDRALTEAGRKHGNIISIIGIICFVLAIISRFTPLYTVTNKMLLIQNILYKLIPIKPH